MLERLLELLLHAKSGVFASVLVLGTTGALVTATVATAGNVTTITLTQASASPSANTLTSPTATPTASPTHSPSQSQTTSPSSSPLNATTTTTTTTCTPDSNANTAVKTVDTAFSTYHTDLMHLRTENKGDAGKTLLANADKLLKQIRQEAVKAIHASSTCKTDTKDDEDEEQDSDTDTEEADKANNNVDKKDESDTEDESDDDDDKAATSTTMTLAPTATPAPSTTVVTTGDAKTIADNAVAAMKLVFDSAKSDFAKLPTSAATPKPNESPEHSDKKSEKKGQSGEHKDND